jgi:hypothetical protein
MPDSDPAAAPGDSDALDPRAAAALLDEATDKARRELDFRSPWLSLLAAAVALVAFGAVWLSVRNQHPYTGPTAASLVLFYLLIAVRIGTVVYAQSKAGAGVSGRSVRRRRAEGAAAAVALLSVYMLMAALVHDGGRHAAFYWTYGVTATLIVLGTFWAACSAVSEDWYDLGIAIAVMLIAAIGALTGPRGMWLSDGVGCCILLLGIGAVEAWSRRAPRAGL